ncbi:MAG: PaaI family thioesterase [Acidimicrobiales bacterium]
MTTPPSLTEQAQQLNRTFAGTFHELVGMRYDELGEGRAVNRLTVRPDLFASNGFLHAAAVVALADSACGHGCAASLPAGASGFTTIELKSNFLGTARDGELRCEATLTHGGRSTQVWDARVERVADYPADNKVVALFRCTQLILYPAERTPG